MTTPTDPFDKPILPVAAFDAAKAQELMSALREYKYNPLTHTLSSVNMGSRRITNGAYNAQPVEDISVESWRMRAIAMRLRVAEGMKLPFQHINTAWAGEKVFVFVVQRGEAVVLTDDSNLFPSDTLITQLRLLE